MPGPWRFAAWQNLVLKPAIGLADIMKESKHRKARDQGGLKLIKARQCGHAPIDQRLAQKCLTTGRNIGAMIDQGMPLLIIITDKGIFAPSFWKWLLHCKIFKNKYI